MGGAGGRRRAGGSEEDPGEPAGIAQQTQRRKRCRAQPDKLTPYTTNDQLELWNVWREESSVAKEEESVQPSPLKGYAQYAQWKSLNWATVNVAGAKQWLVSQETGAGLIWIIQSEHEGSIALKLTCFRFDTQEVTGDAAEAGEAAGTEEDESRRGSRARRLNLIAMKKMVMTPRTEVRRRWSRCPGADLESPNACNVGAVCTTNLEYTWLISASCFLFFSILIIQSQRRRSEPWSLTAKTLILQPPSKRK